VSCQLRCSSNSTHYSQALYGFEYDENRYQNQKNAVRKAREGLDSAVPETIFGRASRDDGKITDPYVNLSFGGQVAIMDAKSPTPMARQSNPMWIAIECDQSM
jgi:hypothetical protein